MKILYITSLYLFYVSTASKLSSQQHQWQQFKNKFQKSYESLDEEERRYKTFVQNVQKYMDHNNSGKSYKMGISQFSDLTHDEFKQTFLMNKKKNIKPTEDGKLPYPEEEWEFECPQQFKKSIDMPKEFETSLDWRVPENNPEGRSAVVAVKNQASCGSCYTFSATGAMEGSLCKSGAFNCGGPDGFIGVSEQQILDCGSYNSTNVEHDLTWYQFYGCGGGWQSNVFQYVYQAGGITCEHMYGYMSGNATAFPDSDMNIGTCKYTPETQYEFMSEKRHGYVNKEICGTTSKNSNTDPELIKQALFEKGPLAMGLYVGDGFHSYESGIFVPDDNECPNLLETGINHALLFVGYGEETIDGESIPYWIIKNSWADTWGEDGYARVKMGINACGAEGNIGYVEMVPVSDDEPDVTTEKPLDTTPAGMTTEDMTTEEPLDTTPAGMTTEDMITEEPLDTTPAGMTTEDMITEKPPTTTSGSEIYSFSLLLMIIGYLF